MPVSKLLNLFAFLIAAGSCMAESESGYQNRDFVRVRAPLIALEHVRVIDGTGAQAKSDQTILVSAGKILAIGDSRSVQVPPNAEKLDFTEYSALPGLIEIASLNGAKFLRQSDGIGTLAAGMVADIVLVKGDPSTGISDIKNVEVKFKDGVGYDSRKLIESVTGLVGIR